MKGRLVVIEGSDGSGKTTQLELLEKHLKKQKIPVRTLDFPQYTNTFFGKTIAKFLRGEIAQLKDIHPYLISMVYAMDRAEARDKMYKWLNNGKTVILNRYVTSNMAHQYGRLPRHQQKEFLRWIDELEYRVNNVPREDLVIFLYVPVEKSIELMKNKDRGDRKYTKGKKDIVEENIEYLKKAEKTYLYLAKRFSHWVKINCLDSNGEMKTRVEIHEEVKQVLVDHYILHKNRI